MSFAIASPLLTRLKPRTRRARPWCRKFLMNCPCRYEFLKFSDALKIALIGDRNSRVKAHEAIPSALALASASIQAAVQETWISTASLNHGTMQQLSDVQGVWCVPGSPYASMEGA